ncbi:putative RAS-2 protein [Venustampulla echinocandica]|uniref:Putative RAS-2 protein n=1 Tax=Venustampulla echinocandica TaxID=2656787 RepID=A0A370TR71_9HELO|nr:putative RAS-2 protein [Venustampulla echinocandica]RDL38017.1 putative RAS-2 protein [Venustampulla echinocandica]
MAGNMAGKMVLYKLVVLGDGGVGKTALTIQLTLQHFVETYDPTIEDSYRKQVVIDGQSCMLEVLDTAGQEEYTALRDQWIRDGEGFVLVYSISSRSSFTRITKFHNQIQRVKESSASSPSYPGSPLSSTMPLAPVPIMLVGNKSDRVTEREVSTQEGHALARDLGCEFVEASAKNYINVEKAFYDVVRQLRRQRQVQSNARSREGTGRGHRTGSGDGLPRSDGRIYRSDKPKSGRSGRTCTIL